jgi:hypothetical protein
VELDTMKCREAYKQGDSSSVFLPDGISVARGRHVQAAYRKPKEKVGTDGTE